MKVLYFRRNNTLGIEFHSEQELKTYLAMMKNTIGHYQNFLQLKTEQWIKDPMMKKMLKIDETDEGMDAMEKIMKEESAQAELIYNTITMEVRQKGENLKLIKPN